MSDLLHASFPILETCIVALVGLCAVVIVSVDIILALGVATAVGTTVAAPVAAAIAIAIAIATVVDVAVGVVTSRTHKICLE